MNTPNLPHKGQPTMQDENEQWWVIEEGRLHVVGDHSYNGGYPCDSWEEAVKILHENGYLS